MENGFDAKGGHKKIFQFKFIFMTTLAVAFSYFIKF